MIKISKLIKNVYIYTIAILLGCILSIGAFVAPSVFYALDSDISNFQSGLIMSSIFIKLSFVLNISLIIIFLNELCNILLYRINIYLLISSLISFICIILFNFYSLPNILHFQALGEIATQSLEFNTYHKQSEIIFKILFFALSFNLIYLTTKDKQ